VETVHGLVSTCWREREKNKEGWPERDDDGPVATGSGLGVQWRVLMQTCVEHRVQATEQTADDSGSVIGKKQPWRRTTRASRVISVKELPIPLDS
jgi:hypothetical protein